MLIIQASLEQLGHWMYGSTFPPQGESDSWDFSSAFGMLSKGEDLWCLLAQGVTFILPQAARLCQTPSELQDWQDSCQFFGWSQRSQVIGHTDHLFPSPGRNRDGIFFIHSLVLSRGKIYGVYQLKTPSLFSPGWLVCAESIRALTVKAEAIFLGRPCATHEPIPFLS